VALPCGMEFNLFGGDSIRRNDLLLLDHSRLLNEKVAELQEDEEYQFLIYRDSAYIAIHDSHIRAKHYGDNLSAFQ
jgi:hypothetical protein